MIIFLTGYMGSGKSRTGLELARLSGYRFIDMDQLIEADAGMTIPEIFSKRGEDEFRIMERKALHSLRNENNLIVATGGGLPCFFDNMDWMNEHGFTVYLKVPAGMLAQRLIENNGGRPLLQGLDEFALRDLVLTQLPEREKYYLRSSCIFESARQDIRTLRKLLGKRGVLPS